MAMENRKYKDSVFTDLFYADEYAPQNLLELYNALYGTHYTDPEIVEKVRLEDVIFMNFKNDLAVLLENNTLFLSEHQSTLNYNIPLRMLLYAAREYEKLISAKSRYRKKMIRIPTPEFITFYNGIEFCEPEQVLKLSDAFMDCNSKPELELIVRVININPDANHEILHKCDILRQYSAFVDTARTSLEKGTGLEEAVKICIGQGILSEYLSRKGSEVINMLTAEYNYQEDLEVNREEARAEGRIEGRMEGAMNTWCISVKNIMQKFSMTVDDAMNTLGIPVSEQTKLKKLL